MAFSINNLEPLILMEEILCVFVFGTPNRINLRKVKLPITQIIKNVKIRLTFFFFPSFQWENCPCIMYSICIEVLSI